MATNSDTTTTGTTPQDEVKELVSKIQQFLSHQIDTNQQLDEAAKESLTVAIDCIEQTYNIQRKPASRELLDAYKRATTQAGAQQQTSTQQPDAAQLITNIASSLFSQAGGNLASAAANIASQAAAAAAAATSQAPQQQQSTGATTAPTPTTADNIDINPQPSAPPKERKNASEAEKIAAESFKNQGNDLMKLDKYKDAYDCYTQAIDIDDKNAIYYCNRAAASAKLGDHQAALRDCQEAISIDSKYSKAYGRMGLAYASMNNHQKAKDAYVKAVELDPTNESYRNNLSIAEEKLAESQNQGGAAGGAAGPNMVNMLRSMMTNPDVMNMAMRSLQDPRVQSMFGLGGSTNNSPNAGNQPPSAP